MRFFLLGYLPLLFQFGALTDCYTEDADRDRINKLPGTELLTSHFNQFSGYLSVTGYMAQGEKTKNLHYWFVESMGSPSTDPIAFWTNGGPGETISSFETSKMLLMPLYYNTLLCII
jgi:Serine carboxypeptidase